MPRRLRKGALLSEPEQVLYRRLVQALPHHVVLAQVQLLQMVRFKHRRPSYDVLNRISRLSVDFVVLTPNTGIIAAIELGKGYLTGASDANHSLSWSYDTLGRVISKGQTVGTVTKTVGYGYTNGDLTTLTTPSGQTVTYAFNANHQVVSISLNGTTLLSGVSYEPLGPVSGWSWGNATTEVRAFNTDGNPSAVAGPESHGYTYDNALRITGISNSSNGALSWTYGYDLLDRINSATKTSTTQGWTYDANGNRLTQTGTVTATYTPSATSSQLNSITGTPARTYTYDSAGNTKTYGTTTLTYWNSGRLKTSKIGTAATTTYVYNALGQRIKKSGGPAGTVLLVYDEAGHLLGEYSSTGALVQETVWLGDIPVATVRPGSPALVYYVHADHVGAPRIVTQPSSNKIAWRWDTDPFGTVSPNQNPANLGTFVYNLRYPGQYYDSETGLFYNYFRDYDPQTGRYVESDPIGLRGGINPYAYVRGNPVARRDPLGLQDQGATSSGNPSGLNDEGQRACDAEDDREAAEKRKADRLSEGDIVGYLREIHIIDESLKRYYDSLRYFQNPGFQRPTPDQMRNAPDNPQPDNGGS